MASARQAARDGRFEESAKAYASAIDWSSTVFTREAVDSKSTRSFLQSEIQFITVRTGSAPDANSIPVPKENADLAMDAAQCIGCGACVAACKNASAALFTSAKITQMSLLPQGQVERTTRVMNMVERMDLEGFGSCSNEGECEAVCPKGISLRNIATMNREYWKAMLAK